MRLGEILIERKLITAEDLERALELQKERGDKIGKTLVDMGFIAMRDVLAALSEQFDVPLVSIDGPPAVSRRNRSALAAIPAPVPLPAAEPRGSHRHAGDGRSAGCRDHRGGARIAPVSRSARVLAAEQEILDAIDKYYGESARADAEVDGDAAETSEDLEHLRDMASEAPVIRLVNAMIAQAVEKRASDIHIEPFEKEFRVRYRVDGVLYNQEPPPREMKAAMISRVKLMAKLNIAERRLPQDGRIKIKTLGREVDLRVSTLPTLYGESVVMRLLDRSAGDFYDLGRLGFDEHMLSRMEHYTSLPHGIFLVTGPTGSGKSTTLYSALKRINQSDKKIITIEDPGGIPDGRDQPDPRESADRADVRRRAAAHRAPGSGRDHGGRNSRPRDGRHRHSRVAHRPLRLLHAAHQRRAQRHHAADRHGRGELPDHVVGGGGAGAAAGARDLPALQGGGRHAHRARRRNGATAIAARGCEHCFGSGYTGRVGIFELMELNDEIRKLIMRNDDAVGDYQRGAAQRHAQSARRRLAEGGRAA